jgi:hypothetical protein
VRPPRPRAAAAAAGAALLAMGALGALLRDPRAPGGSSPLEAGLYAAGGALVLVLALVAPRPARTATLAGTTLLALGTLALASPLLFGLGETLRIRLALPDATALLLVGAMSAHAGSRSDNADAPPA